MIMIIFFCLFQQKNEIKIKSSLFGVNPGVSVSLYAPSPIHLWNKQLQNHLVTYGCYENIINFDPYPLEVTQHKMPWLPRCGHKHLVWVKITTLRGSWNLYEIIVFRKALWYCISLIILFCAVFNVHVYLNWRFQIFCPLYRVITVSEVSRFRHLLLDISIFINTCTLCLDLSLKNFVF